MTRNRLVMIGGSGDIGTVLARHFAARFEPISIDPNPPRLQQTRWIQGTGRTLSDEHLSRDDVLIYLATGAGDWDALLEAEIIGLRHATLVAAAVGVRRMLFASSNHAVGGYEQELRELGYRPAHVDGTVVSQIRPDSEYGAAKVFGEAFVRYAAEGHDLRASVLRIGTVRAVDDPDVLAREEPDELLPGDVEMRRRRYHATWLYHADLCTIVEEELRAPERFRQRFAVSDNVGRFWPLDVQTWG